MVKRSGKKRENKITGKGKKRDRGLVKGEETYSRGGAAAKGRKSGGGKGMGRGGEEGGKL